MDKKIITESHDFYGSEIDYISLEELRDKVQSWIDTYGLDAGFSWQIIYEGCLELNIQTKRGQTDAEYQQRILRQEQERKRQEDNELKELERLKAKYGI